MADKQKIHLYEIVVISCGKLDVIFRTCNLRELSRKYTAMMEKDNKYVRIRKDGQLLTIHESNTVGNSYHPRTKRGAAV